MIDGKAVPEIPIKWKHLSDTDQRNTGYTAIQGIQWPEAPGQRAICEQWPHINISDARTLGHIAIEVSTHT